MKPRLLAAFTAVAMMFATAVPSLLPQTAQAANYGDVGGACKPSTGSIGDLNADGTEDKGVATWVGRDMYIGDKPADQDAPVALTGTMTDGLKPAGSYAVEAEGLTLVKGKLAINQVKNSWEYDGDSPGFRFGAVGFGGNFRPKSGNTALAVAGGKESLITEMKSGPTTQSKDTTVGGWTHGGWVGGAIEGADHHRTDPWFTASLAGAPTWLVSERGKHTGQADAWDPSITNNQNQIFDISGNTVESWGFWNKEAPFTLTYRSNPTAAGVTTNYLNYKDGKDYGEVIAGQSAQLSGLTANGETDATGSITSGTIERHRYNYDGDQTKLGVEITYSNDNKEKVVKFTGTDKPEDTMQVFSVTAADLSSDGFSGTGFEFEKIPVIGTYKDGAGNTRNIYASVVVNVKGNVDFHNGWSFKWNGTEIGEGYYNDSPHRNAYDDAASSIMWNFHDANKVTIRGGMIYKNRATWLSEGTTVTEKSSEPGMADYITSDDPAAAMIGSIMVPKGSFDDHVTTNGRVWVGKDFMMNSPYPIQLKDGGDWTPSNVTDNEQTPTASIIAMDMERHNFGWSASINTACSVIAWNKVNQSGAALGGTSWGIYKTAAAAAKHVTTFDDGLIRYVTDNDMSVDQDSGTSGRIEVNNLTPEANYYIRELDTHNAQYELNPYIYKIEAGKSENDNPTGNPYTAIVAVYKVTNATTGKVDEITSTDEAKQLLKGKIVNKSSGFDIEWGKTESGKTEGLEGSEWILSQGENQWVVRDDGTPINSITIQQNGTTVENITQAQGTTITGLKAVIGPAEANQKVTWSTAPEGYVDVVQMENGTRSVILRGRPDNGQVVLTAAAADGKTDSVTITITPPQVKSIAITPESATIQVGQTQQFTAVVKDTNEQELDVTPTWSVEKSAVAGISADGTVTGKTAGTTKVYAEFGGQRAEATIEVKSNAPAKATTVYVNWIGQSTVYINYKLGSGQWVEGKLMDSASCDPQIKQFTIPAQSEEKVLIYFSNSSDKPTAWKNAVAHTPDAYKEKEGNALQFKLTTDGTPWRIWDDGWVEHQAPDGCPARNAAPRKAKVARAGTNSEWSHIDTTGWGDDKKLADQNPATGKFKVSGLKPGKYTLKENKAPEDYFVNPTEYEITIAEDGTVTWNPEPKKDSNGLHWIEDVPTEFSWTKVDAGYSPDNTDPKRNPIAGSKWRLEKFKAPATAGANGTYETDIAEIKDCTSDDQSGCAIDKDSEAGKFKLTGLALGKYRLVETEAPTGYTKLDTYYYFELSTMDPENPLPVKWTAGDKDSWDKQTGSYNGTATGSSPSESEKAGEVNAAPNYRSLGDVYWGKVSSELNSENKHVYLGGSAWEVTYTPATGDSGQSVTVQITDCVESGGKKTGTCKADGKDPAWAYDAYPTEGRIGFRDLPWGTYTMKETKAPDGYYADPDAEYTFTVDANNRENVKIYKKVPNNDPIEIDKPNNPEGAQLPDFPNQVISNEPGVVLPATGGEGNTLIVLFGFALIAISMVGCGVAMRKRI